uniref:Uncharacterized protein n=1 Tax=Oryza brachyantha TaxID=4533 RepID=J3LW81_ORYBR
MEEIVQQGKVDVEFGQDGVEMGSHIGKRHRVVRPGWVGDAARSGEGERSAALGGEVEVECDQRQGEEIVLGRGGTAGCGQGEERLGKTQGVTKEASVEESTAEEANEGGRWSVHGSGATLVVLCMTASCFLPSCTQRLRVAYGKRRLGMHRASGLGQGQRPATDKAATARREGGQAQCRYPGVPAHHFPSRSQPTSVSILLPAQLHTEAVEGWGLRLGAPELARPASCMCSLSNGSANNKE